MPETQRRTPVAKAADEKPVVKSDVDPEIAAGQSVEETKIPDGYSGTAGFEVLNAEDEKKESKADSFRRAQVLAPHLTEEFVSAFELDDETVRGIADGMIPPPPAIGPNHTSDMYLTPGGWVQQKPGVPLDAPSTAISR